MGCGVSNTSGSAEDEMIPDLDDNVLATDTSLTGMKVRPAGS